MGKTYKIQKAHEIYKLSPYPVPNASVNHDGSFDEWFLESRTCGQRYGNQRKFRSYLKWEERKNRRRKENREFQRELRDETTS